MRKLYIEPCAGLGNRFYALVSAFYWAEKENLELNVVWKRETACGAKYNVIFEENQCLNIKDLNQIFNSRIGQLSHIYSNVWLKLTRNRCKFISAEEITESLDEFGMEGWIPKLLSESDSLYIKSTQLFMPEIEIQPSAKKYLKFNNELIEQARKLIGEDQKCIGIHIRRNDNIEAQKSSTELFEKQISKELEENPETKFYIASDDSDEIENLKAKFGNAVILKECHSDNISRISDDGIKDAVVDILALSLCKKIYGSNGSTFSKWASLIGDTELIIVGDIN